VHEFMNLDSMIDVPARTFDYGFLPQMEEQSARSHDVLRHPARRDHLAGGVEQRHLGARRQAGRVHLLDAAVRAERRLGGTRAAREDEREGSPRQARRDPPPDHGAHSTTPRPRLLGALALRLPERPGAGAPRH